MPITRSFQLPKTIGFSSVAGATCDVAEHIREALEQHIEAVGPIIQIHHLQHRAAHRGVGDPAERTFSAFAVASNEVRSTSASYVAGAAPSVPVSGSVIMPSG